VYQTHDLLKIQRRFPTELACRKYLQKHRWPQGIDCRRCGSSRISWIKTRDVYQCRACRYQVSLTAGTIFHKTRTSLRKWFWLILLMGHNKHGISMLEAQRLLGIGSYQTTWTMCHKIRTAMAQRDSRYKLAGLIEMDDSLFGRRKIKGQRRRRPEKPQMVRLMVGTNRFGNPTFTRMEVTDAESLDPLATVRRTVVPEQTIRTDGGNTFYALPDIGFKHEMHPRMSHQEMDRFLPWVSTVTANVKRFLLGTHHFEAPKHLQRFLDEFSYRFNRRFFKGQLFDRLLTACATTGSVRYADLIG